MASNSHLASRIRQVLPKLNPLEVLSNMRCMSSAGTVAAKDIVLNAAEDTRGP